MAARCTATICWRAAGRLVAASQAARPAAAAALQEAATQHGNAGSLAQRLAGGGAGRSLLPVCAQGLADSRGQRRWAKAKVMGKKGVVSAKAAATGATKGNPNAVG